MITREQVADLRKGDVVELSKADRHDCTVRGSITRTTGSTFGLGAFTFGPSEDWDLTVVSRAPRPLYVNHPRTEPVPGDVVRDADSDSARTWHYDDDGTPLLWRRTGAHPDEDSFVLSEMPRRLRLLVDGETGQVVPS